MKHASLISFFLFSWNFSVAQNLILNPGFEEHGEIAGNSPNKDNLKENQVKSWTSPNIGSPDYFNSTTEKLTNAYGSPKSHSGNAFAGAVLYGEKKEYREYIMGEINIPLESGKKYYFSMAIALAEYAGIAIEEMGVYFSKTKVADKKTALNLKLKPQLRIDSLSKKMTDGNWIIVSYSYIAKGGEKYITIGNFKTDNTTQHVDRNVTKGKLPNSYYYFDDVSLIAVFEPTKITPIAADKLLISPLLENGNTWDTLGIVDNKKLVVNKIYFEEGKSTLTAVSFPVLDGIFMGMKSQPNLKVEINGYTDEDGDSDYNLQLSQDRANAVANYFKSKGTESENISTNGFGNTKPIGTDKNINRRVEFIFSDR